MSNAEIYASCFCDVLGVAESDLEGLEYQSVEMWDSVGHMALVSALEDAFDIMMEAEDIFDLSSFKKGKEILANTYGVAF